MLFCSLIEELCTKEENYKTSCNFNFGHECIFNCVLLLLTLYLASLCLKLNTEGSKHAILIKQMLLLIFFFFKINKNVFQICLSTVFLRKFCWKRKFVVTYTFLNVHAILIKLCTNTTSNRVYNLWISRSFLWFLDNH